jgi:hypothetical protein
MEITQARRNALNNGLIAAGLGLASGLGVSFLMFKGSRTPVLVGLSTGIGYGVADAMHRLRPEVQKQ